MGSGNLPHKLLGISVSNFLCRFYTIFYEVEFSIKKQFFMHVA